MVVFLLLGVIWAAVLVPPWLQSRREARPIASIMSFRSQLWSLERATPRYGADHYSTYGEDVYDADEAEDELAQEDAVHAFELAAAEGPVWGPPAPVLLPTGASSLPIGAVAGRRAQAYRRRRQVLSVLVLATGVGAAPAVVLGGAWVVVEAVAATLLVAYLGLLIRRGHREAERTQKVRYLTPVRAPRPSVVVFGSGAAR